MAWVKEPKCFDCGMKYEDGKPVYRDCFVNGWSGGTNDLTGNGISIGDFGSLRYCNWEVKKAFGKGKWIINGDAAKILLANTSGQYEIDEFLETEQTIILTDIDGKNHNVCCCEMIFIEWQ